MRGTLVVFAKDAVAGRVKTRLARELGSARAAAIYRRMLESVVRRLAADPRWRVVLAVSPDRAAAHGLPGLNVPCVAQGGGDLGRRMQRVFDRMRGGPVVIVGSDIPDITRRHVASAFHALGRAEVVIGPADDGGYWLIGQRRRPRVHRLFRGVRWSGPHAMADTLANVPQCRVAQLDTLPDLDTAADWRDFLRRGGRLAP